MMFGRIDPAWLSIDIKCDNSGCGTLLGARSYYTPISEVWAGDIEGGYKCHDCDDVFCNEHLIKADENLICNECNNQRIKDNQG